MSFLLSSCSIFSKLVQNAPQKKNHISWSHGYPKMKFSAQMCDIATHKILILEKNLKDTHLLLCKPEFSVFGCRCWAKRRTVTSFEAFGSCWNELSKNHGCLYHPRNEPRFGPLNMTKSSKNLQI